MHSASVFLFDRNGRARYVTMSTDHTAEVTTQLENLLSGK
jgi:cytochrome oxidase Cu insertion factor (SCO1/SenC/PrrC family)